MASDEIRLEYKLSIRKKNRKSTVFPLKKDIEKYRRYQPKAPPLIPNCRHTNCNLQCNSLTEEEVKSFHKRFYFSRDRKLQDAFILRHCEGRRPKSRKRGSPKRKRQVSALYFVSTRDRRVRVCRAAFAGILRVNEYRITSLLRKIRSRQEADELISSKSILPKRNKTPKKKVTFAKINFYKSFRDNSIVLSPKSEINHFFSNDDLLNTAKHIILDEDLPNLSDLSINSDITHKKIHHPAGRRRCKSEVPNLKLEHIYSFNEDEELNPAGNILFKPKSLRIPPTKDCQKAMNAQDIDGYSGEEQITEIDNHTRQINTDNSSTEIANNDENDSRRETTQTNGEQVGCCFNNSEANKNVFKENDKLSNRDSSKCDDITSIEKNTETVPSICSGTIGKTSLGLKHPLNVTFDLSSSNFVIPTDPLTPETEPLSENRNENDEIQAKQLAERKSYLNMHTMDKENEKKRIENEFFLFQVESNIKMQRKYSDYSVNTALIKNGGRNIKDLSKDDSCVEKDGKKILYKKSSLQAKQSIEERLPKRPMTSLGNTEKSAGKKVEIFNKTCDSDKKLKMNAADSIPVLNGTSMGVSGAKSNRVDRKIVATSENICVAKRKDNSLNNQLTNSSKIKSQALSNRTENFSSRVITGTGKRSICCKKDTNVNSKDTPNMTKNNSLPKTSKPISNIKIKGEKKSVPQHDEKYTNKTMNVKLKKENCNETEQKDASLNKQSSHNMDNNTSKQQKSIEKCLSNNALKSAKKDDTYECKDETQPSSKLDKHVTKSETTREFTWSEPRKNYGSKPTRNKNTKSGRTFNWSSPKITEAIETTERSAPFEVIVYEGKCKPNTEKEEATFKQPNGRSRKNVLKAENISATSRKSAINSRTSSNRSIVDSYNSNDKENIPYFENINADVTTPKVAPDVSDSKDSRKADNSQNKKWVRRLGKRNLFTKGTITLTTSPSKQTRVPLQALQFV